MPSNTPQLDSEELLLAIQISLPMNDGGKIVVDKYHLQEFIENYCKKHRAAFADRVLAVVPEKQDAEMLPPPGSEPDTARAVTIINRERAAANNVIDQVTTAIANLVAEERGEKKG